MKSNFKRTLIDFLPLFDTMKKMDTEKKLNFFGSVFLLQTFITQKNLYDQKD